MGAKQDMATNLPQRVEAPTPKPVQKELTDDEKLILDKLKVKSNYHSKKLNDVSREIKMNRDTIMKLSNSINEKLKDPALKKLVQVLRNVLYRSPKGLGCSWF